MGGGLFLKKCQILEKKEFHFALFHLIFKIITAPKSLKGSRNIQGFALIREVLLVITAKKEISCHTLVHLNTKFYHETKVS